MKTKARVSAIRSEPLREDNNEMDPQMKKAWELIQGNNIMAAPVMGGAVLTVY